MKLPIFADAANLMVPDDPEAPDGETALALLQAVYRNKLAPLSVRMRAATIAIQYESPRLQATAILRDENAFAAQLERALMRSAKVIELKANDEG
jgi:hypothetical protein